MQVAWVAEEEDRVDVALTDELLEVAGPLGTGSPEGERVGAGVEEDVAGVEVHLRGANARLAKLGAEAAHERTCGALKEEGVAAAELGKLALARWQPDDRTTPLRRHAEHACLEEATRERSTVGQRCGHAALSVKPSAKARGSWLFEADGRCGSDGSSPRWCVLPEAPPRPARES